MANIKSSEKRAVQNEKVRKHKAGLKSTYRTYIKKVELEMAANKKEEAVKAFKLLIPVLDKMVAKGIMHENKAARYKTRLNDKIKNLK